MPTFAESSNAYLPRHLPGAQQMNLKRIAVLLPFSSTNAEVKKQSEGIYNAIQMALFQVGAADVVLMRRDATSADPAIVAGIGSVLKVVTAGLGAGLVWPALLRKLDRADPSYRT